VGTRDVSQGPYELFASTGHFEECRPLLLDLYSHEIEKTGEWPQWFMLDKYAFAADDCHGDIVFWPLRILADYLLRSGDGAILNAVLPFQDSLEKSTLEKHVSLCLDAIERRFIPGTDFISYGGGDWDDTLQPADPSMKSRLVSPWTQELAYQTLTSLAEALPEGAYRSKASLIALCLKKGYDEHFVCAGEIPGFLYVESDGSIRKLVYSADEATGIHCRLLPYTRAIIAQLASKKDAEAFDRLIDEKLAFPDGVRLMDKPARYEGGVNHLFVRAEQAANVGREISLCYVHADIRYAESMAVLGEGEKVLLSLKKINPIRLDEIVKNAAPRQANTYFSSSDPDFNDRYEFAKGIAKLRAGEVAVRGGWRVYSSGNGIYIARLLGDLFGLRPGKGVLAIDPVLSKSLEGSVVDVDFGYGNYHFVYHLGGKGHGVKRLVVDGADFAGEKMLNPYREAGVLYPLKDKAVHSFDVYTY
jgi:cellobiose phosphorylase